MKKVSLETVVINLYNLFMEKTNDNQLKILSHLLFNPKSRFRDLNVDKLSTDTFSYHVNVLLDLKLIEKSGYFYSLTNEGKMTASKIDTDQNKFEKQPKVSVIVIPHKIIDGVEKFVIHQRTKEPYFGYWGFISGKIKWGDTIAESAEREMQEEIGISGKHRFCYEIHEMVYEKGTNKMLEDKFFQVVEAYDIKGEIIEKTKEGANKWVTAEEFLAITPKYHNEDDIMNWYLSKDFSFKEEKYYIEKF